LVHKQSFTLLIDLRNEHSRAWAALAVKPTEFEGRTLELSALNGALPFYARGSTPIAKEATIFSESKIETVEIRLAEGAPAKTSSPKSGGAGEKPSTGTEPDDEDGRIKLTGNSPVIQGMNVLTGTSTKTAFVATPMIDHIQEGHACDEQEGRDARHIFFDVMSEVCYISTLDL
jgi:hypothetical protein